MYTHKTSHTIPRGTKLIETELKLLVMMSVLHDSDPCCTKNAFIFPRLYVLSCERLCKCMTDPNYSQTDFDKGMEKDRSSLLGFTEL